MIAPLIPANEQERLSELNEYSLLDTLPEDDYDNITQLASQICDTPITLITLVDSKRQWFKSAVGIDAQETPREYSFCGHAINMPTEIMVVPDSREDVRFFDNPFVTGAPNVIFYAGVPLVTEKGYALGTLCVIDDKPHVLTNNQLNALRALSISVVRLFELRKSKLQLEKAQTELERKNLELERFASMAAHDLKSPLSNISSIISLLKLQHNAELSPEAEELLLLLDESSQQLRDMVDGILEYTRSEMLLHQQAEEINLSEFFKDLVNLIDHQHKHHITFAANLPSIKTNKQALKQIFLNLIANGIAYNDKQRAEITLGYESTERFYQFWVTDNGIGIAPQHQERVFKLFERGPYMGNEAKSGNGIGLSTVKKLVEKLGGEIKVQSTLGKGTTMFFSLPK